MSEPWNDYYILCPLLLMDLEQYRMFYFENSPYYVTSTLSRTEIIIKLLIKFKTVE